jgi:hypothetical protein
MLVVEPVINHRTQHALELVQNGLATSRLRRTGMTILHNPATGRVSNGQRSVRLGTESVWYSILTPQERFDLCRGLSELLGLLAPDRGRLGVEGGHVLDIRYDATLGGWYATTREV